MTDQVATPQPSEQVTTPEPQKVTEPVVETPRVQTWHDSFTDEKLKTDESIKKYKTLDEFGKAYKEKDSMIGRKGVILPNEKDPKDIDRFLNELGRPPEASKYANPEIKIEDEFKQFYSEERINNFKNVAHKYGLTQKQFEGLTKEYTEQQLAEIKGIVHEENKRLEESTKGLMNEWLMDYEANSKQAELALKSYAKDIPQDKIDAIMKDPDVKRIFFNVAQSVSEDRFRQGGGQQAESIQTLQAFIDSQVKTAGSSYYNQRAPDHKATKQKVEAAYEKLAALRKVG